MATPVPSSGRDLHRAEDKAPYAGSTRAPVLRELLDSDENATMAMDRDALDVLPGGGALRTPKPMPVGVAPIPHFRPATAMAPATIVPHTASNSVRTSSVGAPLAVWVFAAILAGIISYHVAPEIMARLETPARATPSER